VDATDSPMLVAAQHYATRGLAVFPCAVRDKIPATPHGFKDATTNPGIIADWWKAEPNYNLAVATGAVSDLFVVDVDDEDGEASLSKLEAAHTPLPPTVQTITARGRHLWWRHPKRRVPCNAKTIIPGCDIRGDGGYVVAPPSIHRTGKRYTWSVDSGNAIAPAPDWLVAIVTSGAPGRPTPADRIPATTDWATAIAGIPEGRRDCTLAKVTGYLLRHYIAPALVLDIVQLVNAARCAPPLPTADVDRIVDSISRKELNRRNGNGADG
jgi:Bifunctional DNA primase/polymerase, N-terminal/Primase C terminal 1 (PriCT-1)